MARMKAPAGGAIVNNQYQQGGRFLPRAFQRISRVIEAYRNNPVKLGRELFEGHFGKHVPQSVSNELVGTAGLNPAQATLTHEQLRKFEDAHGLEDHERLTTKPSYKMIPAKDGKPEGIYAKNEDLVKFFDKLGTRRLKGHELAKKLRDNSLTGDEKLSYIVPHLAHDSQFYGAAQEAAGGANQWYGHHVDAYEVGLHKLFASSDHDPVWGTLDHSMNRVRKDKPHPGIILAKFLTAITSGNQNPRDNASNVVRMIELGRKNAGHHPDPFSHIPDSNTATLDNWLAAYHKAAAANPRDTKTDVNRPGGKEDWASLVQWYKDHVYGRKGMNEHDSDFGYKARHARIVDRPGHEDHMKLISYEQSQKWKNVSPDSGRLYNTHKEKGDRKSFIRNVRLPVTDEQGNIIPKGWSVQNEQVVNNLDQMKQLIAHFTDRSTKRAGQAKIIDGMQKAADWLLEKHPDADFKRIMGRVPERGYLAEGEHELPGSFMAGPKFGPFFLNLNLNTPDKELAAERGKYLTADRWWSRTWNRYLNTMYSVVKGKKELQDAPRSDTERKQMWKAAGRAASHAGLNSVAELQAVLWYYEQNMWRWFGANAKSFSYLDGINYALRKRGHPELRIEKDRPVWQSGGTESGRPEPPSGS